jgi:predicted AlkP superfamily pyrophosphatase or phosphodiesterase
MRRLSRPATVAAVALALTLGAAAADRDARAPKLVVMLMVDQMRADYVDRFRSDWTSGLKRLLAEGAWFRRAAYPFANTVTCAGHATVATGAFPHVHGISHNAWWDRRKAAMVTCTEDPQQKAIGYDAPLDGGDSAASLLVPTLSDRLRETRDARVVTMALKDRAAVMLAGRRADAVTWRNPTSDVWETSTAYATRPVTAVGDFLRANPIASDYGRTWSRLLPASRYKGPDDALGETPPAGWTSTFPHVIDSRSGNPDAQFRRRWEASPYADAYIARMAVAVAESTELGRHSGIDFLGISFSSPDIVGHAFGPASHEVQDMFAHLDRTIGRLLDRLDALVGRGEYVVAFSSDHGVTPIPDQLLAERRDAGRVNANRLRETIERSLVAELGGGNYVARLHAPAGSADLYLNPEMYEKVTPRARDRAFDAILAVPGVARVFSGETLRDGARSKDPLLRAAALSYVPDRSGDWVILPKAGWVFLGAGATHGNATPDDQRVPLILMGRGIRGGEYSEAVTPADIAPTLAELTGVTLPKAEGRVLREALAPTPSRTTSAR